MENALIKDWINQFQAGNDEVFYELYEELKTPVYTIIFRILYDEQLSEDVMQETFIRVYRSLSSKKSDIKNPRAWIFQISRNLAIDHKRKQIEIQQLTDDVIDARWSLEASVSSRIDIELALLQLSQEDREIVTLHLSGDLKFREIAELIDRPLGTVLWRYRKAVATVQEILNGGNFYV